MTTLVDLTTAVANAFKSSPALCGGRVYRGRRVPLAQTDASMIEVNAIRHAAKTLDLSGQDQQWETTVVANIKARAAAGVDVEATLDPLITAAWARMAAIVPPAGVFGFLVDPVINIDLDEADHSVTVAPIVLRITHITTAGMLTA